MNPQIFMGLAIAAVSALALRQTDRLLEVSRMGRRLLASKGQLQARTIVNTLLLCAFAFGVALAAGWINPRV